MDLGQKIKRLRLEKKLRQEDLGLAVGAKKPRNWGSQLETGKIKNLKNEHAIKLGELLGVDTSFFYIEIESTNKVEDPLIPLKKFISDPAQGESKKEIIFNLTTENRLLIRENAYLKSLLLKHKIEVYNTDNQNDTV